jgi:hypothetical protein
LFYLDQAAMLKGRSFRENYTPLTGSEMDINSFSVPVNASSRMSAYWPWLMTQNTNGSIQWFRGVNAAPNDWWNQTIWDAGAAAHAGFTLLPTAVDYVDAAGFVYASDDGILSTYIPPTNNTAVPGWSWTPGE